MEIRKMRQAIPSLKHLELLKNLKGEFPAVFPPIDVILNEGQGQLKQLKKNYTL